jgi:glycerophosphoryl diester phosphodiesterase
VSELPAGGPLLFGHRGFSGEYPENTLPSFAAALDLGVDGCECDVHLSKDGVPFLMHDHTFQRTGGVASAAAELTYDEIRRIDVGRWKGDRFANTPPPTLGEALELHQGRGLLAIELKTQGDAEALTAGVLKVIDETGAVADALTCSFGLEFCQASRRLDPRVPCVWILSGVPSDADVQAQMLDSAISSGLAGLSIAHNNLDAAFVRRARRSGLAVWCWTVNDVAAMEAALAKGVDGVISDRPDLLGAAL